MSPRADGKALDRLAAYRMIRAKNKLFLVLLVAAVGIWCYDISLFSLRMAGQKRMMATTAPVLPAAAAFVYRPDYPDPFYCEAFMKVDERSAGASHRRLAAKPDVVLPACKIGGIVYNPRTPMAIFVRNGTSKLVKQNDMVDSILIKEIRRDSVRVVYKGKTFLLAK